ncbi:arrestin domain-containing protein 1a [Pygocentrus nattereri]|uniref:Arrestin C-terminal-like domain-containing protein n=1 Tax=Pygocentrus nattereri TaxID=42514 RepID=A0A3B4CUU8_PYGNA|nr:arrestin domain-containing protein 1a [Pygocentrus nattereri]
MGKLQAFEITLKDNKVVYSPGESISGTVKVNTAQPIQCKEIKVNCQGYCGVTNKANDTAWVEEEQYFSSSLSVADKGTLKQGEHSFPFKFLIPATAPTSYEGPYGRIMYRIRAFIDTPRFAKDYRTEKPFYMLNNINLNEVADINEPSSSSVTKNFSYNLVKNGTVVLTAKSDLRGYAPGQVIKVSTEIDNRSGKSTGHVVASLMQKVTYNTKRPTQDLRAIAEVEGAGVKGGKQAEWKEQIIVPPLPQSSLAGCDLIKINYFIQVSLKYPEVLLTLPIHIGNIAIDPSLHTPSRPAAPLPRPRATPSSTSTTPTTTTASRSASTTTPPQTAPRPAPRPRPRSTCITPSAPPPEPDMLDAGSRHSEEIPTKIHSQQQASGSEAAISPNAFSYAPGLSFPQNQRNNSSNASAPQFCISTGATIPFFTEGNAPPVPTNCPLILPPEYRSSSYPHEPPPSYEDSCTNT